MMSVDPHKLKFLQGDSPSDLLSWVFSLGVPVHIISIYAQGVKHCLWYVEADEPAPRQKSKRVK